MESATPLPSGTITFLFTDIEGSTRLWEEHPEAMEAALARHDTLAAELVPQHAGTLVKQRGEGDSLFAVFPRAAHAVAAAAALQRAFCAEPWPAETPLRVRMALHTGDAAQREGDYYGAAVNRCARLRAVAHGGQVLLSQTTCDLVRNQLPAEASLRDLGSHRLRDLQQPEHLYQLLHPSLPTDFPPLRSLEAFSHNLPVQLSSFVGREREMAEVKRLMASTHLLTLTGSGGCGKTRLGLQVAGDLLEEYPDGVWLVELAALADPALVPQTVASALGVREEPGRPLTQTLADSLRAKSLLLVLDNCEHLLTACAQLADTLLHACPKLRILASSREGLGINGEQTYRVPSLALPDAGSLPPLEKLQEFEAVQLFADRARLSQPTFALTSANAPAVVQVCRRLDGIPLAIELAAARVRSVSVEQINARLDDMFRLLTGGSRTALPRQQTLRAAIDWSHKLLSEAERALLRRLSVFAGGWTLPAAEAVGEGDGVEGWEVLDLLTSLVDKSLVLYEEREGEGRYRLLETVRQYARDRLMEAGEAEAVRGRHRDWFLALAEEAEPQLWRDVAWIERLEREHDNLRAALEWCAATNPEAGLRLSGALHWFWHIRDLFTEGLRSLERALAGSESAEASLRRKALCAAAQLAGSMGDNAQARAWGEESLVLCREAGDKAGMAWSLLAVAGGLLKPGGPKWMPEPEEALSHFRQIEDKPGRALALYMSAMVTSDVESTTALHEECLALCRSEGYPWLSSYPLEALGWSANWIGQQERARALLEESLAIRRDYGDRAAIMHTLHGLQSVARAMGDMVRAAALNEEALALARESGNKVIIANVLEGVGSLFLMRGEDERARVHLEESVALFRELDRFPISARLSLAAVAQARGDHERAGALFEELQVICEGGLTAKRERGEKRDISWWLLNLGRIAQARGDHEAARPLFEESLAIFRELGDKQFMTSSLRGLRWDACLRGEYGAAAALGRESLAISRELQQKPAIAGDLESLAAVAGALGQPERAARLFGTAEALCEAMGAALTPAGRAEHDRSVASARAMLGEEAFAAAWAEGRALSLDDAIKLALEGEDRVDGSRILP